MSQPWWNTSDPAEEKADAAFALVLRLVMWAILLGGFAVYKWLF